jgi:hypothetical protein
VGSSPTTPTNKLQMDKIQTPISFKYKDKIYTTTNLEKKLNKLGIGIQDIEILKKQDNSIGETDNTIKKYYFKNKYTGDTLVSIYDNL